MLKTFLSFAALVVILLGISSSGCVRLNTYEHQRVDLEMSGNRGYVTGNLPSDVYTSGKTDRKVIQLEFTLPGIEKDTACPEKEQTKGRRKMSKPGYQPKSKSEMPSPKIK